MVPLSLSSHTFLSTFSSSCTYDPSLLETPESPMRMQLAAIAGVSSISLLLISHEVISTCGGLTHEWLATFNRAMSDLKFLNVRVVNVLNLSLGLLAFYNKLVSTFKAMCIFKLKLSLPHIMGVGFWGFGGPTGLTSG